MSESSYAAPLWHWLKSQALPAADNMAFDEALLEWAAQHGRPVLRFYAWSEPAASFGYFQRYAEVEQMTPLRPLVRRPTGGGLVPHDADWTYSLAFPTQSDWYRLRAVESYHRLHDWIRRAFEHLSVEATLAPERRREFSGQCFAQPEQFDLMWQGRKLAGAAQRRTRLGLLIQGSIQPAPSWRRTRWEEAMLAEATRLWQVRWQPLEPAPALLARVAALVKEKYGADAFHRRR